MATAEAIAAGWAALAEGAWLDARERFEAALAARDDPDAWEGLGWAGWWLSDAQLTVDARERAFSGYRAAGDLGSAARVAGWLAADYAEFFGKEAVGRGWLERARRLLEGTAETADRGWLALHEGTFALLAGRPEEAVPLAASAARIGRQLGVADLEAIGLAQQGRALVSCGRVEEGMRCLDESSVVAVGERLELQASLAWALCYQISACASIGDLPRATHWCDTMRASAERWGARIFIGVCRTSYGSILSTGGDWPRAESELEAAVADFESTRPGMAALGLVRLAELRVRQGRLDEARSLLDQAGSDTSALIGLGQLSLEDGDPAAARDAADRVLRRLPAGSVLDRLPALELRARAEVASGNPDAAGGAIDELLRSAQRFATPYLRGRAHLAAAEVAVATGELETARRLGEDAADAFSQCSAPYERALARMALARALDGLGRRSGAISEAQAALATFDALGAERDAARARALVDGPEPGNGPRRGELTARELEVLRLVAGGLSDAAIAEQLVLSPHTVHRHVANVRRKLRQPSRAAAVAYATRAGLL